MKVVVSMEAGSKKFRPIIAHVTCYLDLNFSSSAGTPANRQFQPDHHQDTGRVTSAPFENVLPISAGKGLCPSSRASSPPFSHSQHYLPGLSSPSNNHNIVIKHAPRRTIERSPSSSILNSHPTTNPNHSHYYTNPLNPR